MPDRTLVGHGADVVKTMFKGNPWALFALACLLVAAFVSVAVPRLFAGESHATMKPEPAVAGDSRVTVSALEAALMHTASDLLIQFRADLKAERDERQRSEAETRAALNALTQRIMDLKGPPK